MRMFAPFVLAAAFLLGAPPAESAPTSSDRLTAGAAAPEGSLLVAGDHGATYALRGGATIELAPGTEFSFMPSMRLKLGKPGEPETLTRVIHLERGQVEVTVPSGQREPTALLVRGPGKMNAVTKGGRSTFLADKDRSTVAVRRGEALVGNGNEWKALREGFARTAAPEDPSALPRPLLAAPAARVKHALALVRGTEDAELTLAWDAVKDADGYAVDVMRTDGNTASPAFHGVVKEPATTVSAMRPGTYSVTVSAVDRYGLAGLASDARAFRVVGLEVPDGSVVMPDGVVVLGRDQRVSLVGAGGLEVSYGSSQLFGRAPATLGLAHNEPTVVRLRAPGSEEESVLKLEPMGLRARVDIAPHDAHWPVDPVTIRIDLYDAAGRPVPDDARVDTKVTVNLAPVDLAWTRTGRTLSAKVPAPTTPGPWVVRAEVRDGRGDLLGRDFLEIAPIGSRVTGMARR